MNEADRDALLIRLDERTLRADKALFGNGRPGLVAQHAGLVEEVNELQRRAPTQGEKKAGWAAIMTAVITSMGTLAATLLTRN